MFIKTNSGYNRLMPKDKGFTLIELLVVISILAILSIIGLTAFGGVQKSARDARRKSDLRSIKVALELYKQSTGSYPSHDYIYSSSVQPWISELDSNYFGNGIPVDPINTKTGTCCGQNGINFSNYVYIYWSNGACGSFSSGQFFILITSLENKNDQDRNEVKNYKYCDNTSLYSPGGWGPDLYIVTSL